MGTTIHRLGLKNRVGGEHCSRPVFGTSTWNLLSGYRPNVWHIQDQFVKQDADARRAFLSNSVGQDMADNTGRKQRAKDAKQRVKLVVEAFATMPKTDYLKMLAHDLQRASAL